MTDGQPTTGPEAIEHALGKLDLDQVERESKDIVRRGIKTKRPDAIKRLGYVQGFKRGNLQPKDLMLRNLPVIPPQFRPFTYIGDAFVPGDANELYQDFMEVQNSQRDLEKVFGPDSVMAKQGRRNLYDAMRSVYGFGDPVKPETKRRGVSGFLKKVSGRTPKFSYPQRKLLSKDLDFTGRGVIAVDPNLGLDEIGVPDEMAWTLYSPYVQRRLVRSGMKPSTAIKSIKDRGQEADSALNAEMRERPVVYSRAPAWHKFNVISGYPRRVKGSSITINPLVTSGLGADFDGDTVNVHLPSMPDAVDDARQKLLASKMLFSDKERGKVMPTPKHELILGLYSSQRRQPRQRRQFASSDEALKAIQRGEISLNDEVEIP